MRTFSYSAQTADGRALSGTIDAIDYPDAQRQLQAIGLRVLQLESQEKPRGKAIKGEDFIAFNQQLAQLTAAGLPIEQGLRLIAQDMHSSRLGKTVEQIAEELERGVPLGEAFGRQRGKFPSLYGRLIDAGVKTNNLPAMLMNLGMHVEMVHRLRGILWRAVSYPLMVFIGLLAVLGLIGVYILPQFEAMFRDFQVELPAITKLLLAGRNAIPFLVVALIVMFVVLPLVWWILRLQGKDQAAVDYLLLPVPLIGPALKRNRIGRWCDAMRLGVEAGLDLPAAVDLAGQAVGSPLLIEDGDALVAPLQSGQPLQAAIPLRLLPGTVPAAMALAVRRNQLAETLGTLAQMYQQQAEMRMNLIPAILTPILLVIIAVLIGIVILGLFAPLMALIQTISGG